MPTRRTVIAGAAAAAFATVARAQTPERQTHVDNVPLSASNTITVERRDDIVLIGLNRPQIYNRLDPPTRVKLAQTMFQYEHDPSQAALVAGQRTLPAGDVVDPLGNSLPHRTKPLVVVAHGDTWNLGHEL